MEYPIFEKMQNSGWNLWDHQQKFRHEFISVNNNLQSISRQFSILRFFSKNIKHIPSAYSPISFEDAMKQKPIKFLDKFSTNQYIYVHDYLVKLISYPRTMSSLLGSYFTKDCLRLHFFARVTFPSIYHNFITEELHKAGASLVKNIILTQPYFLTKAFMLSFIEFTPEFLLSIWSNYEQMEKDFKERCKNDKNEHPECLSTIFLSALSKSLTFLSKSQIKLFEILLNHSEKDFGTIILFTMFPNSFYEYFHHKINDPKKSAIYQMLQTASFYPNSPFFKNIAKMVTSPSYTKIRPSHKESGFVNQTPIVLSLHELFLIQQIIFSASKSKSKNENSEKISDSEKNQNSDILSNNKILTYKKKLGIFVFSPELCKSNFDPIFLDLNLSTVISKVKNPTEISIFSNSPKLNNQNQNQTENFIKKFNGYLASLSIEKVYKKIIRKKKLELFIIIGVYSQKCIDHSMNDHKSASLLLRNTGNYMQSTAFTIPSDSLNFINVGIPTSLSINSIYQADYAYMNESEKNDDIDNIDAKEKKVQNIIDQFDLNENVKEKVNALIDRFGRPDDEISMFILIQQLDIIKMHSKSKIKNEENEEEEAKNEDLTYLELNYPDSFKKFKEKISKFNKISKNSLKNGYFQKFVKKCAEKIDELADVDHFRVIFELVFIGLELNEMENQFSKSDKKIDHSIDEMIPFINSVFLNSNGKMFDVFVWYHKFVSIFPEIKKFIPKKSRKFIDFFVDYFYSIFEFNEEKE